MRQLYGPDVDTAGLGKAVDLLGAIENRTYWAELARQHFKMESAALSYDIDEDYVLAYIGNCLDYHPDDDTTDYSVTMADEDLKTLEQAIRKVRMRLLRAAHNERQKAAATVTIRPQVTLIKKVEANKA